jgi:integrase/recombinase XerD
MMENAYIKGERKSFGFVSTVYGGLGREYLEHMRVKNHSAGSLLVYCRGLRELFSFLAAAGVDRLQQVDAELLEQYKGKLLGRGLAVCTVDLYLRTLKQFFRHLEDRGELFLNPAAALRGPRPERKIGYVPDVEEMRQLLAAPDTSTTFGVRDRALIETTYSTGARLGELTELDLFSPDLNHGALRLAGKGRKDRVAPLGKHACFWLGKYLADVRPRLLRNQPDEQALWLDKSGRKMTRRAIELMVCARARAAGLRRISPHAIRRACATHMLQNGAQPLAIQTLLGHATMKTLSQYLRLTITELKAAHRQSRLGR